jgi:hypothetical protein|tara:strand:+ start:293 stop:412 length:120 start_codon:yes stop_codon:yes gene_type:complete
MGRQRNFAAFMQVLLSAKTMAWDLIEQKMPAPLKAGAGR